MKATTPFGCVTMAMSLDGFIAREDHSLDWLMRQNMDGEDHGFEEFFASIDGMIMGSGSLKTVLKFGEWRYATPVIVLSQSMKQADLPEELTDKVEISDKSPKGIMDKLAERGWNRVYVDGGKVVQSFLREGLISEITVAHIPILIGSGIRMFGELNNDIDLDMIESKSFPSGIVKSRYKIS